MSDNSMPKNFLQQPDSQTRTLMTPVRPPQTTPFMGRREELAAISARLADPTCRLLTLIGQGGIGKTRLALEAASEVSQFRDGVYFVPLQPISSGEYIVPVIAEVLGIQFFSGSSPEAQLLSFLSDKSLLLILDNLEHLLDSVTLLTDIVTAAKDVKLLATSRERLNLLEEWVLDVRGLQYPIGQIDDLETYSAVQLFTQTARRVRPTFHLADEPAEVIRICQLVEGMPLGIELAASWTRVLSCREIVQQLERGLDLLEAPTRNMPPRHRSMRAVLDHSWVLLSEDEQAVLKRLSVFRGGFTLEAAGAIAGAALPLLASLMDKSWLRFDPRTGRYDLHELVRQYGEEQLKTESSPTQDAHCGYYARLMERQGERLKGREQGKALELIEIDLENVRAAWNWGVQHRKDTQLNQMIEAFWHFYDSRSRFLEGEQLFASAAASYSDHHSGILGRMLARQGALLFSRAMHQQAIESLQVGLSILREHHLYSDVAFCLVKMGQTVRIFVDRVAEAKGYIHEGVELYRAADDRHGIADGLHWLSLIYNRDGDVQAARQTILEALRILRQLDSPIRLAEATQVLALFELNAGNYHEAVLLSQQAADQYEKFDVIWGRLMCYRQLAQSALGIGNFNEARHWLIENLTLETQFRLEEYLKYTMYICAKLYNAQHEIARAIEIVVLVERQLSSQDVRLSELHNYLDGLRPKVSPQEFVAAIERGKLLEFHPTVQVILADLKRPIQSSKASPDALTSRELEVLGLLEAGLSNRAIAEQLILSLGTVKWYVNDIYSKLGVNSRTQALHRARELKLLS